MTIHGHRRWTSQGLTNCKVCLLMQSILYQYRKQQAPRLSAWYQGIT